MSRILLYGDSVRNPNLYYRTGFLTDDPVIYYEENGAGTLVVGAFEKSRAKKESRVANVKTTDELGYIDVLVKTGDVTSAEVAAIRALTNGSAEPIRVESSFPVLLADRLRGEGIEVNPDRDLMRTDRRLKNDREIEAIAKAQARAEQAIRQAVDILSEAVVVDDAVVYRGVPLTAERLKADLEISFIKDGFSSETMIVAPGPPSSDPHWTGSGPIRPGEPVIFDIFPQDRASRYHGDVTRSFVKGEAPPELQFMYDTVKRAQQLALDMIKPGANGREVHEAVMKTFADAGFRDGGGHNARCLHGTGHGLGLAVHERPRLSRVDEELKVGDVVTVEPGLYDPALGGVRIEDVVVLVQDGNRNLNRLPKELVIP